MPNTPEAKSRETLELVLKDRASRYLTENAFTKTRDYTIEGLESIVLSDPVKKIVKDTSYLNPGELIELIEYLHQQFKVKMNGYPSIMLDTKNVVFTLDGKIPSGYKEPIKLRDGGDEDEDGHKIGSNEIGFYTITDDTTEGGRWSLGKWRVNQIYVSIFPRSNGQTE